MGPGLAAGQLDIGIIGAGRVGTALGNALRAAGHRLVGVAIHSPASEERAEAMLPGVPHRPAADVAQRSDLVLIAVPDDALAGTVTQLAEEGAWRQGQLAWHTAGRYGTAVLQPAAACGALPIALHPAMTFSGTSLDLGRLEGTHWALTAPPLLAPIGHALAGELGGIAHDVREEDRVLYHAALAHGANHLVTLVDQAAGVLSAAGIGEPGEYLAPLLSVALQRALASGPSALTGPAARGDAGTIAAHLAALRDREDVAAGNIPGGTSGDMPGGTSEADGGPRDVAHAAITRETYAALARATALMAGRSGQISPAAAAAIAGLTGPAARGEPGPAEEQE